METLRKGKPRLGLPQVARVIKIGVLELQNKLYKGFYICIESLKSQLSQYFIFIKGELNAKTNLFLFESIGI